MQLGYWGWKVTYGFLLGNLFAGWSSEELETLKISESVSKFTKLCQEALQEVFPCAKIEVLYQEGEGVLPERLRAAVHTPWGTSGEALGEALVPWVENTCAEVYASQEWQVPA
jgi:hypothetical protein